MGFPTGVRNNIIQICPINNTENIECLYFRQIAQYSINIHNMHQKIAPPNSPKS